jgi:uncharacterized damage-inducible protein DinB
MEYQETLISNYISQLYELYCGENWLGESFEKKLSKENETSAFEQPVPGVHSVAEIVWHCIYWRETLIKRMEGDPGYRDRTVDECNFLPPERLQEMGWEALRNDLEISQKRMNDLLAQRADNFLDVLYDGTNSYRYLIEGIIQHDSYHLGQIGLVQKIRSLKPVDEKWKGIK